MILFCILLIFITVSYAILIILLLIGFNKLDLQDTDERKDHTLFLSVVIPYRNEEKGLPELIKHLNSQSYPSSQFEVIFVNDHSGDDSYRIIAEACREHPNFRSFQLADEDKGKKSAISVAVKYSKGSYVIQTDADIILNRFFIEEHAKKIMESRADLIAGPVACRSERISIINSLEVIDMLSLTGTGAGSYYYENPIMCSGANLSYRKSFFLEAEKYDQRKKTPSGDDMFLLIAAKRLSKKIVYLKSNRATVFTFPTGSVRAFLRQRIRWGSKAKYYEERDIIWVALQVTLANMILLFSPLLIVFNRSFLSVVISCLVLKFLVDFIMLRSVARFTNQSHHMRFYPLVALLYYFYFVYAAVASLFSKIQWKERTYEN